MWISLKNAMLEAVGKRGCTSHDFICMKHAGYLSKEIGSRLAVCGGAWAAMVIQFLWGNDKNPLIMTVVMIVQPGKPMKRCELCLNKAAEFENKCSARICYWSVS